MIGCKCLASQAMIYSESRLQLSGFQSQMMERAAMLKMIGFPSQVIQQIARLQISGFPIQAIQQMARLQISGFPIQVIQRVGRLQMSGLPRPSQPQSRGCSLGRSGPGRTAKQLGPGSKKMSGLLHQPRPAAAVPAWRPEAPGPDRVSES